MFDVPVDNRIEFVYRDDVALAIVNALECEEVWGKVWNIGGGSRNQFLYGDIAAMILDALWAWAGCHHRHFPQRPIPRIGLIRKRVSGFYNSRNIRWTIT